MKLICKDCIYYAPVVEYTGKGRPKKACTHRKRKVRNHYSRLGTGKGSSINFKCRWCVGK